MSDRTYIISPEDDGWQCVLLIEHGDVVRAVHCLTIDAAVLEGETWIGTEDQPCL